MQLRTVAGAGLLQLRDDQHDVGAANDRCNCQHLGQFIGPVWQCHATHEEAARQHHTRLPTCSLARHDRHAATFDLDLERPDPRGPGSVRQEAQ